MAGLASCDKVRSNLTAFVEGWLDDEHAEQVSKHLASCESCRIELRRESALVERMGSVPFDVFEAPAWSPVKTRFVTRFRLALAASFLFLAFVAIHMIPLPNRAPTRSVAVIVPVPDESWSQAHLEMSVGDYGLDPNRAIVLARVRQEKSR